MIHNNFYNYINTVKEYSDSFIKNSTYLDITSISLETLLVNIIYDYKFDLSNLQYLKSLMKNPKEYYNNEINIKNYDNIIYFYNITFNLVNNIPVFLLNILRDKNNIFFYQDEYLDTDIKSKILKDFNSKICFVNVNEKDAPLIFNNKNTTFINVLTGYIPDINYERIPIYKRTTHIFYRATPLGYIYGDLGQEKVNIGKVMKKYGLQNNLIVNIEWEMDKKIYGEEWYDRLLNSKTTLATECGCKVFNQKPRNIEIQKILEKNSKYTYEQAKKDFKIEPMYESCQVSPKMFEAIKLGTVLIMYEGEYKGIFKPNIHYIELKKDHSNIEDVIEKIKDDEYLQQMANVAYTDIIENSNYTYKDFIEYFESVVKEKYEYINKKMN